jgi:hypothetical protein
MPRCAKDSSGRAQQKSRHASGWRNQLDLNKLQQFHNLLQLTFSCSWRVSFFNHTNGTFNSTAQPPQPTTPAAADLTLTKDVQYSLAPEERIINEMLKPTRPICCAGRYNSPCTTLTSFNGLRNPNYLLQYTAVPDIPTNQMACSSSLLRISFLLCSFLTTPLNADRLVPHQAHQLTPHSFQAKTPTN